MLSAPVSIPLRQIALLPISTLERGLDPLAFNFKPTSSGVVILQADLFTVTANASPGDGFSLNVTFFVNACPSP